MDALTFRTPKLLRKMASGFSSGQKQPIIEIDVAAVLTGLNLTYDSFIDLCIMMGCDYCGTIKGVGPKTALTLIRQHGKLENIVKVLLRNPKTRANVPPEFTTRRVKKADIAKQLADEEAAQEKRAEQRKKQEQADENENAALVSSSSPSDDAVQNEDGQKPAVTEKEDVENNGDLHDAEDTVPEIDLTEVSTGETASTAAALDETILDLLDGDEEATSDDEYEIIPPVYIGARELFFTPEVVPAADVELKWTEPDEPALREFLVEKMGFNLERVNNGIKKLQEAQKKKSQGRMDTFFSVAGVVTSSTGQKRKADEQVNGKPKATKPGAKGSGAFAKKR